MLCKKKTLIICRKGHVGIFKNAVDFYIVAKRPELALGFLSEKTFLKWVIFKKTTVSCIEQGLDVSQCSLQICPHKKASVIRACPDIPFIKVSLKNSISQLMN